MPRRGVHICLTAVFALFSCRGPDEIRIPSVQLRDPLGLSDVVGDLRLLVFSADDRLCDSATGELAPRLSDEQDASFEDAIVDITFSPSESASVDLDEGTYTVNVRGRGVDPVSGRSNVIVARGCASNVEISEGETREITIDIRDVVGEGVCMDSVLSPDEQCEPSMGPNPCVDCRTQELVVNTTTDNTQESPSAAWAPGSRLLVSFDNEASFGEIRFALRDERGDAITSPAALGADIDVDNGAVVPGPQIGSDAAMSASRFGVTFGDFSTAATEGGDIMVRLFSSDRNALGPPMLVAPSTGAQTNPAIAMMSDGGAMVVFEDQGGVSGRVVEASETSPAGSGPFAISASGSSPDVAAHTGGFVATFADGGIKAQRFASAGNEVDAEPFDVAASGDEPAVASLPSGMFLVVFRDGDAIIARPYDSDGAALESARPLNTTQGSPGPPTVAASSTHYLVSWELGGTIRARVLDANGNPTRNRESPPTGDDFALGSGTAPSAAASDDLVIVTWAGSGDVQGRLLPLP